MEMEGSTDGGCTGLSDHTANTVKTHSKVSASQVTKTDGPFYCPECFSDAIVRKCDDKVDHFAHKARQTPIAEKYESELHKACKRELCEALQKHYPEGNWDMERPIPANEKTRMLRPDISGRPGHNKTPGVVIEVQVSRLKVSEIVERTELYHQRGCAILWVIPLKAEIGNEIFRPRHIERYLHSLYFGRCYYWLPGSGGQIIPVHFGKAQRFIEESTWFDESGTEQSAGGYFQTYGTIKTPVYGSLLDVCADFLRQPRNAFKARNERLNVPECTIYHDRLARWWVNAADEVESDEADAEIEF